MKSANFLIKIQFSGKLLPHLETSVPVSSPQCTCLWDLSHSLERLPFHTDLKNLYKILKKEPCGSRTSLDFKTLSHHTTIPEAALTKQPHSCVTLCQIKYGAVRKPSGKWRELISVTRKSWGRVTPEGETSRSINVCVEVWIPAPGCLYEVCWSRDNKTRKCLNTYLNEPALIWEMNF